MTTPNKPKPTAKELLTEFMAECGFQLMLTLVIGMLGTLVGFVIWTSFWALFFIAFICCALSSYQKTTKPVLVFKADKS